MTNSHTDTDELKTLQREAEELRTKNSSAGKVPDPEEKQEASKPAAENQASEELSGEEQTCEQEKSIQDLADQIESAAKELEEAAQERPVLALMAAFGLGIIVGQIFSRR